ncbi:MAG TPA: hypothetical protein VMW79_06120 [Anaerolineae bacterium]|nr:hypothetical protein [Anaerolineae bacterium]HUW95990.1 hypothetical protein [Anaerolineae bacterium]
MANPAAEVRARVLAAHPEAVVVERGRNSLKHRLADAPNGRQRFALDSAVGPLHYQDGEWQEIDTAFLPSVAPWNWEMVHAGFQVRALSRLDAGQVIEYRNGSEWVRFQPMALQYSNALDQIQPISMPANLDAAVDDDTLTWPNGYGSGVSISWQAQTARLAKRLTIDNSATLPPVEQFILDGGEPVLELNFIFAYSKGVTPWINGEPWDQKQCATQGLVEFRDGDGNILWWFNLPRSWDAEGNQQLGTFRFKRVGNALYVSHRVPLGFVQTATYPLVVDVDVDEQVGAGADDANEQDDDSGFSSTEPYITISPSPVPSLRKNAGFRFTTVGVPADATVGVAYLSVWVVSTTFDDPCVDILGNDVDDANNFSVEADVTSRARTSESVPWIDTGIGAEFQPSPSIVDVVQEIVDRDGWANNQAMVIFLDPRSSGSGNLRFRMYETASANAAKLHIEYTAGGAPQTLTPDPVVAVAAVPSPVLGLVLTLALATAVATAAVPSPALSLALTLTPTPVAASAAVPSPVITQGNTLTPNPVVAQAAVPGPLLGSEYALAPTPAVASAAVPSPALSLVRTLTPDPVVATASVPSPATSLALTLTPTPAIAQAVVPSPSIGAITLEPTSVVAIAVVPSPVITQGNTLTPTPAVAQAAVPSPVLGLTRTLTPDPAIAIAAAPSPALTSLVALTPSPATATAAVPQPALALVRTLTPDPAAAIAIVPSPAMSLILALVPNPAIATAALPSPALSLALALAPTSVVATAVVPEPGIDILLLILQLTPAIAVAIVPTPFLDVVEIAAPPIGPFTLLQILKEARQMAEEDRRRSPVACPKCGEPLDENKQGTLNCPMGHWQSFR